MHPFTYVSVTREGDAFNASRGRADSAFIAGGTNLVDEMKLGVRNPSQLVDINKLPLAKIETVNDGALRIGALVSNTDVAYNATVRERYPVLSEAILSGASPQLRNMATTGGNLLQRTRCYYYRDTSYPCNKREPGTGCSALTGFNRMHAILGTSEKCIATHPSDMAVALAALDAKINVSHVNQTRAISINEFYIPYGEDPAKENVLNPGDLIASVELPDLPWAKRSHYLKVRDRASYEFALASAAIVMDLDGKNIRNVRIALGGVGTKPWRAMEAEQTLLGKEANEASFVAAAEAALKGAMPREHNAFKVELCKRTIVQALTETAAMK